MKNRILQFAILLTLLLALAVPSRAAVTLVLHIDGIQGSSTLNGHAGDMDCIQFSWSVTNYSGIPSFSGLQVQKFVDKASPYLALGAAAGTTNTSATVTAVNTGATPYDMYKIVMTNVVITSDAAVVTTNLTETVSLRFTDVQWTYTPNNGGLPGTPVTTGWNLANNTPH